MNLLFEIVTQQGFILDLFGVLGLGLVAVGALRISRRMGSRNASLMTWGALSMLAGRIGILLYVHLVTSVQRAEWDAWMLSLSRNIPVALLTFGLGAIVYGFWSHEKESEEIREFI